MKNRRVAQGLTMALIAAAAAISMPTGVHAATDPKPGKGTVTSQETDDGRAVVSGKQARTKAERSAAAFVAADPAALKLGAKDEAVRLGTYQSSGLQYVSYDRTHQGLRVVGGDFVVAADAEGNLLGTSVAQDAPVKVATTKPAISEARAEKIAKGKVSKPAVESTELVILQGDAGSDLAYETIVTGTREGGPSRLSVFVDAATGKVLSTKEHVAEGTGSSAYSGTVSIPTQLSGSTYSLIDPSATTLKCQNASGNVTYTGTDDSWGNGDPTNRETGCVDAFYGAQQEKGMLTSWLGRSGMDGSGGWVPIRVGLADVNAYYDGTQVQIGHSQSGSRWIGSIDVVAHEFGHGIDDHTPGGISGGNTQEFIADTFGAATEWYDNQTSNDTPDYTVGEEVDLVGNGPIRNMYNPSLAGDDNCYSSSTPNDEVHAAAGPGNHWFYLLAEGSNPTNGQPTSPTCNSSTVTGVGIQKAMKIMYNAMLLKTSSSSYLKYRTWTLTAAKNLYGTSTCTEFNAVKAAWNAVSVPAQTGDPTCTPGGGTGSVTVTSPGSKTGTVGTAISSFTVSASGGTSPYTFTATGLPAGVSISSAGTVSGTPTTAGTYTPTVTATDSTGATGSTQFTFTISGTGGGTCSGQKLTNPGFESGATGWTASSGVIDSSTSAPAHSGSYKAWLNGYGATHTDTLSQSVTIPSGCAATLTFWLYVDSDETTTTSAYDKLTVKAGSTTLATYSNLDKGSGYVQKSVNLSGQAGSTVTLTFTGTEDSSLATSFLIDDTAVNLS